MRIKYLRDQLLMIPPFLYRKPSFMTRLADGLLSFLAVLDFDLVEKPSVSSEEAIVSYCSSQYFSGKFLLSELFVLLRLAVYIVRLIPIMTFCHVKNRCVLRILSPYFCGPRISSRPGYRLKATPLYRLTHINNDKGFTSTSGVCLL